ncbi:hypothetical protein PACTADRAFT_82648 [Pachysolen tannophilus NRRL Y-2460]|uniref:D-lactate dehydrogenase (cytochrome) n=1 Tax=Pachysolen tannophilus NRRL Y-2460 TaxID=669874 RepID=A0A1E4TNF2_PACTA|nr:hypothetical protein PACTADRAFT_82648 [Pachysolen tannophilus NRRL Y-2460]
MTQGNGNHNGNGNRNGNGNGGSIITIIYYKNKNLINNGSSYLTSSTTPLDILLSPKYATKEEIDIAIREFIQIVGDDHVSCLEGDLEHHSDSFYNAHKALKTQKPRAIVYPSCTQEVSAVMKICHKYHIPVVAFGGGTSIEGHYVNTRNGISLDLSRMDRILEFNKNDLDVVCDAGVGWQDLNEFLSPHNLMIGVDPGPGAQLGGMTSCNCSGTNAFQFGTMKENVIGLEVVLADGTIITTRQRPRKTSAGYNLTGLFIGSEGTLGIITKVKLKVHVKPENEGIIEIQFESIEDATNSVKNLIQKNIKLNAIELLNNKMMQSLNLSKQLAHIYEEKATLFLKISGASPLITKETIKQIKFVITDNNATYFKVATNDLEKQEIWSARKLALWSAIQYGKSVLGNDAQSISTDVAVPISDLPEIIKLTEHDIEQTDVVGVIVGHVGDGNFHSCLSFNAENEKKAWEIADKCVERAVIQFQGTCSGEHGIGYGKRKYLELELGSQTIDLMRRIKMALDPLRILNPDKILKIDPADIGEH